LTLVTEPKSGDKSPHSLELLAALRLALVRGVGPRVRMALIERFGAPQAVFAATPSELESVPNVGHKVCQAIRKAAQEIDVAAMLDQCRRQNVELILDTDLDFPPPLKEIADPPGLLFVRGRLLPQDAMAIAIVGSRHATHYGLTQAEKLAGSLARAGLTVVSGLARGIDAAAHRGALAAGGRTIAVLASGVVSIYPPEHTKLAEEIAAQGALISEAPPHAVPKGGCFPQRNRIISGLAQGVIVVEAAARSGALITAHHAAEQGRDVFALPGPVDSRMSRGCHRLIREGAALIESADDVLEQLGPLPNPTPAPDGRQVQHPGELLLTAEEQQVYAAVKTAPMSIDDVITRSALPPQRVLAALSVLEMRHLIKRLSGQRVCRVC
jgi:DNA processing protein